MALFTKAEILALGPCRPWHPSLILDYLGDQATGPEIEAYVRLVNNNDLSPCLWLMGATLALATEFVEENGLNVNLQDTKNGKTALHYAVLHRSVEAITYLLGQGASKILEDLEGRTAVALAYMTDDDAVKAAMGIL